MALRTGVYPSALLVLVLLAACQGNGAAERISPGEPPRAAPAAASGRVECAGECRVERYDGTALTRLPVAADGTVNVPLNEGGGTVVLFVSAPGRIPQVKYVGADRPLGLVRLEAAPDPTLGGYLALATVKVVTGGKRGGGVRLAPAAGTEVALTRGRARDVLVTDQEGVMVMHLPVSPYGISAGGERHPVQVPLGGTAVLPLVVGTIRVD